MIFTGRIVEAHITDCDVCKVELQGTSGKQYMTVTLSSNREAIEQVFLNHVKGEVTIKIGNGDDL